MPRRYKKKTDKAAVIIIIICLLAALFGLKIIFFGNRTVKIEKIYAGIGGAVNDRGVYEVREDTRIYELIIMAKGLAERANIKKINV